MELLTYFGYYLILCLVCVLITVWHTYVANTQKGEYKRIHMVHLKNMLTTIMVCFIPVLNVVMVWCEIADIIEVKCYNFSSIYPFEKKGQE